MVKKWSKKRWIVFFFSYQCNWQMLLYYWSIFIIGFLNDFLTGCCDWSKCLCWVPVNWSPYRNTQGSFLLVIFHHSWYLVPTMGPLIWQWRLVTINTLTIYWRYVIDPLFIGHFANIWINIYIRLKHRPLYIDLYRPISTTGMISLSEWHFAISTLHELINRTH